MQLLNYNNVASELELSVDTVKSWTSVLEATGIILILQPFSNNALNRVIKTPKIFFKDAGLVCYLTKMYSADIASVAAMAGSIFETFVISEIVKSYSNAGKDYRMRVYYYRGKDKQRTQINGTKSSKESEIDLIIEEDGVVYPIEIKLSANPKLADAKTFYVLDKVDNYKRGMGAVICRYDNVQYLSEDVIALPVEYI
ncbi:MAG: ATP-binding protein [Anaerovoracaceae bacterium]